MEVRELLEILRLANGVDTPGTVTARADAYYNWIVAKIAKDSGDSGKPIESFNVSDARELDGHVLDPAELERMMES